MFTVVASAAIKLEALGVHADPSDEANKALWQAQGFIGT